MSEIIKNYYRNALLFNLASFVLLILLAISITSCSTTADINSKENLKDKETSIIFYNSENGEKIKWEADFMNNEIVSLYKNGKQVPADQIDTYKDMVFDKLNGIKSNFSEDISISIMIMILMTV